MAEVQPTPDAKPEVPKAPEEIFRVVINSERQYSIWPDWKKNAPGWEDEGKKGTKQECLDHIEKVWTDMRPLSLQKFMAPYEAEPRKPIVLPPMPTDGIDHFHSCVFRFILNDPVIGFLVDPSVFTNIRSRHLHFSVF
jgi:MbtH protein